MRSLLAELPPPDRLTPPGSADSLHWRHRPPVATIDLVGHLARSWRSDDLRRLGVAGCSDGLAAPVVAGGGGPRFPR